MVWISEDQMVMVHHIDIPSMGFSIGCDHDVQAKLVDVRNNTVKNIDLEEVKNIYRQLEGKTLRIEYWKMMKQFERGLEQLEGDRFSVLEARYAGAAQLVGIM